MAWICILACVFIVWWIINDWDRSIPPGFDEALRNAERDHGKQDDSGEEE